MEARADGSSGDPGRVRLHLAMGWCLLSLFIALGMALEGMLAFKLGWFLDLANETRRLLFRLAHAHGVLLGLVNIAVALSLPHRVPRAARVEVWISRCLLLGSALLPAGFLLGGVVVLGGDPNPAILLSAIGAPLLFAGALGVTWSFLSSGRPAGRDPTPPLRR
jgi:hypothetical protein